MPLSDHVTITITRDTVAPDRAGFGIPLIASHTAAWAERVRSYNTLQDVAADFATTTSPEYLAAQALFSQNPKPTTIKIGRCANKPTQVYTCSISAVRDSYTYSVTVAGAGFATATASYTSDGSATDGEIVVGLVAAINAVSGNNFIAAGATSPFTVTADAAGGWFSLEVNPVDIEIAQTHADPGIAADLTAIATEDDDWYCLLTNYNSNALVLAAAGWVESVSKIYLFDVNESDAITTAITNSDTLDDLSTAARARTSGWYHPSPADMLAASVAGRCLPLEPGSETWSLKGLSGPDPVTLTSTHRTNLVNRHANSYQRVAGLNRTFNGMMADGDFIDVTRGLDWLEDDMSAGVFGALAGADKIPYTDQGVAVIEAEVRASLQRAVERGILASSPAPVVTVPRVADVSSADKAARLLPDVNWSATLAGAVHKVTITGVVSV